MSTDEPTDFTKLIPELPEWNNGAGISVESWVACSGSFELAVGYSRLFWPDFVEHDGCVLFADSSEEMYRGCKERCPDRKSLEAVLNHRHVFDYFSHAGGSATEEQILYLGRVLKDIWQARLVRDFPGRTFVVSFPEGPYEDLFEYEVTFWQASETDLAGSTAEFSRVLSAGPDVKDHNDLHQRAPP